MPPGVNGIIGPDEICMQGTYQLDPKQTANWSISNGHPPAYELDPISGIGTSITVYVDPYYNYFYGAWLTAEVNGISIHKQISSINNQVYCKWPYPKSVDITDIDCGAFVELIPPDQYDYPNPYLSYEWEVVWEDGVAYNFPWSGSCWCYNSAELWFSSNGGAIHINAYLINEWGVSPHPTVVFHLATGGCKSYSQIKAYPNPATDMLTVDLEAMEIISRKDAKNRAVPPARDVRLYDGQGNLLRQRKTRDVAVQFNVANLPNGIYYLHVYDGINEKPKMQQIIVER